LYLFVVHQRGPGVLLAPRDIIRALFRFGGYNCGGRSAEPQRLPLCPFFTPQLVDLNARRTHFDQATPRGFIQVLEAKTSFGVQQVLPRDTLVVRLESAPLEPVLDVHAVRPFRDLQLSTRKCEPIVESRAHHFFAPFEGTSLDRVERSPFFLAAC
jgi:hypothetical protein